MKRKKCGVLLLTLSLLVGGIMGCGAPANDTNETVGSSDILAETVVESTVESEDKDNKTDETANVQEETVGETKENQEVTVPEGEYPTAQDVVNEIIIGWNLGNSLDSYKGTKIGSEGLSSETYWGNPTSTKEMIDLAKELGFNAIRVPVTWYNHMDPETYEIDKEWMDRAEEVVNYVLDNDLYCIINVHHDTGEKGWLKASSVDIEEKKARFTAIWEQIAERFGEYEDKLLFEGFNEILDDQHNWVTPGAEAVEITNELNQIFVDTVRASGKNNDTRCLIVNTYCAGGNKDVTKGFVLPTDTISNKLIVEAHIYQPFYFTSGSTDTWASGKTTLDSYIRNMYTTFVENGIPVIIGEFGCVDSLADRERQTWLRYYVNSCYEYGIKCFWWDNGSEYKLFNRKTMKVTEPELIEIMMTEANGGTYEFDATVWGDANGDKSVTYDDLTMLQNYLSGQGEAVENCDINKDGVVDALDEKLLTEMLEELNNLCANEENWGNWIDVANGGAAEVVYTENGIQLNVDKTGKNTWDVQIAYKKLTFEQGASYKISFDYTGSPAQNMSFHVMQDYGTYQTYFSHELNYAEETQHYEGVFQMTENTDTNAQLGFDCGASKLGVPYTITIENLVIIKLP